MRLEHHLVGGYVRYISPHIIIIIKNFPAGTIEAFDKVIDVIIVTQYTLHFASKGIRVNRSEFARCVCHFHITGFVEIHDTINDSVLYCMTLSEYHHT